MRREAIKLFTILGMVCCTVLGALTGAHASGPFAYIANTNGSSVSVIDTTTNTVSTTIAVASLPAGVAVNLAGTRVYVSHLSASPSVSVIDTYTNSVIASIPVGSSPIGVAVNPSGTRVYVAHESFSGSVSVIDTTSNSVIGTISVGSNPWSPRRTGRRTTVCLSPSSRARQ